MGISIFSNSGKKSYGIKHYIVDKAVELVNLNKDCAPGSTAFIIENSKTYMLNTQKKWIQITLNDNLIDNNNNIIYNNENFNN